MGLSEIQAAWASRCAALAQWAQARLVNRTDVWGGYLPLNRRANGQKVITRPAKAQRGKVALTTATIEAHFRGADVGHLVGLHAIGADGLCRWIGVDVDNHGTADALTNHAAAVYWFDKLTSLGFSPLLTESSNTGGYHLLALFSSPVLSTLAYQFGRWLAGDFAGQKFDRAPEIFPKQPDLAGLEYGNWLRLPGRHHTQDHWSRAWNGSNWLEGAAAVDFILGLVGDDPSQIPDEASAEPEPPKPKPVYSNADVTHLERLERCRAYLATLDPSISGQRGHDRLYQAAVRCVRFGLSESDARLALGEFNLRCQPSWSDNDIQHKVTDAYRRCASEFGSMLERDNGTSGPVMVDGAGNLSFTVGGKANGNGHPLGAPAPASALARQAMSAPSQFPADLLAPPGFVGELCRYGLSTAYMPQPILIVGNMLAFFGAVIGRKVMVASGLRTNLYCLGVGDSGCGKDHSRQVVKMICEAAGIMQMLGGEDVSSDTAILDAAHAQPSILFQWDEIGHFISHATSKFAQNHQRAIPPLLTKLFSSARGKMLGKQFANQPLRKDIDQPNVCLYGTTVPRRLYDGLSSGEIADGFLGRMLVFQSDAAEPVEQDVVPAPVPASIVKMVQTWFHYTPPPPSDLGNITRATGTFPQLVPMEPDAVAAFKAFRSRCKQHKQDTRLSGLDPIWSRAVEHATKVALVVASGEMMGTPSITGTTAAWSIKLVEHLTGSLIQAVGHSVADNEHERDVLKVLGLIRRAGASGLSQRDLSRRTQWLTSRRRNEILTDLLHSERIGRAERKGTTGYAAIVYTERA